MNDRGIARARASARSVSNYLKGILERLNMAHPDLPDLHGPDPPAATRAYAGVVYATDRDAVSIDHPVVRFGLVSNDGWASGPVSHPGNLVITLRVRQLSQAPLSARRLPERPRPPACGSRSHGSCQAIARPRPRPSRR